MTLDLTLRMGAYSPAPIIDKELEKKSLIR